MALGQMIGLGALALVLAGAGLAGGAVALAEGPGPAIAAPAEPRLEYEMPAEVTPEPAPAPETGYVIKRILPVAGPMKQGEYYWDEAGVPAGPVVITVDLQAQTLSIFRDGYEIGTAVIVFGAQDKPTPLGVFSVTQKKVHHISNLYGAPMPHMLRLTNDGIAIHGSEVGNGYVTHGCVGVPAKFAKLLFGAVKLGDRVIITKGEMLDLGQAIKAA